VQFLALTTWLSPSVLLGFSGFEESSGFILLLGTCFHLQLDASTSSFEDSLGVGLLLHWLLAVGLLLSSCGVFAQVELPC